ncbi:MAG: hypothetical protein J6112_02410 [Clostridia bacterium]|nr:hypothetical protein [Clostridia bacterium]
MLIYFKCPECGLSVQADDSTEQLFCEECGAKMVAGEAVPQPDPAANVPAVTPDASVVPAAVPETFDDALAAYDRGEFETAYKAFAALGGDGKDAFGAKLFAGLANAALSKPLELKFRDGITAAKNAAASGYFGDDRCTAVAALAPRLRALVTGFTKEFYTHDPGFVYGDANLAKDHFDGTCRFVEYYEACADLMNLETLRKWPELEAVKKSLISETLDYIKLVGKPVNYLIGYKNVVKSGGLIVPTRVEEKMNCPFSSQYKTVAEKLKTQYNAVPSTVDRIKKFDEEISANRAVIEDYKSSSEEYFAANPEDGKVYKRWRLFTSKKAIEEIEAKFPQTLKDKKTAAKTAETAVESLISEKKKFEKANLI